MQILRTGWKRHCANFENVVLQWSLLSTNHRDTNRRRRRTAKQRIPFVANNHARRLSLEEEKRKSLEVANEKLQKELRDVSRALKVSNEKCKNVIEKSNKKAKSGKKKHSLVVAEKNGLERENKLLKQDLSQMSTEVDKLKEEIDCLKRERSSLKRDRSSLERERSSLQTKWNKWISQGRFRA